MFVLLLECSRAEHTTIAHTGTGLLVGGFTSYSGGNKFLIHCGLCSFPTYKACRCLIRYS